jgi:rubredoxin
MEKYRCIICGYIYDPEEGDPESGIVSGISFADLPADYTCPLCGAGKEEFLPEG